MHLVDLYVYRYYELHKYRSWKCECWQSAFVYIWKIVSLLQKTFKRKLMKWFDSDQKMINWCDCNCQSNQIFKYFLKLLQRWRFWPFHHHRQLTFSIENFKPIRLWRVSRKCWSFWQFYSSQKWTRNFFCTFLTTKKFLWCLRPVCFRSAVSFMP